MCPFVRTKLLCTYYINKREVIFALKRNNNNNNNNNNHSNNIEKLLVKEYALQQERSGTGTPSKGH